LAADLDYPGGWLGCSAIALRLMEPFLELGRWVSAVALPWSVLSSGRVAFREVMP